MERVLYNAFGASISTDGQRFFYVNPLQRRHDHVEGDDPGRAFRIRLSRWQVCSGGRC